MLRLRSLPAGKKIELRHLYKLGFLLICPILLIFIFDTSFSAAQGRGEWSEPLLLFQVDGSDEILGPFMVSDLHGNVHVIWSVTSGTQSELDKLFYMRHDVLGWTVPVDIVAAKPVRAPKITVGLDNFIYLIWQGANDDLFFSRAPLDQAEIVKNWSDPAFVTEANAHADITASSSGDIFIAYPSLVNSGVFVQDLKLSDQRLSSPMLVSLNSLTNTVSDDVNLGISLNGTLHIVWTEYYLPNAWPPRGVFYANSIDSGNTWSDAVMLAGDGYDEINITVQDDDNIHVAWNGMVGTVGGRYYRMSSDGGETWSQTFDLVPAGIGGTEGPPQLVVDSADTVHVLTTYEGCAWYTLFINQRWAPHVCISGEKALESNYIEEPAMTISEENKLHAVFWDGRKRLWYTTKTTDAPWLPPENMIEENHQPT